MSNSRKDPVALAREILEGKGKTTKVDEGLKKALKTALEGKQEEFNYEGKTYNVADFDVDEAHEVIYDAEKDSGGETVPAPDLKKTKDTGKKTKKNVNKPSDASADDVSDTAKLKGQAQKEGVQLDIDYAIGSIDESDDMVALFGGEDLSEDFKTKARTIFETAVKARVKDVAEVLEFQASDRVDEITEANKAELVESLDDYLSYVVEEWVKENQVALDRGIKSDIAESFMMGLKNLFEAHYIDMPDEKFDVVSNLETKVEELAGQVSEEIQKNVQLNKELSNCSASETFAEVSCGLVDTQVEKLSKLAEGLEYDTVDQFREKLNILKESYFGDSPRSMNVLNEEDTQIEEKDTTIFTTNDMKRYSRYMDREAKHNNY